MFGLQNKEVVILDHTVYLEVNIVHTWYPVAEQLTQNLNVRTFLRLELNRNPSS